MTELQTNGESSMNKDNFDSEAPQTMTMRLCGDLYAQDYGEFEMPIGAEIKEVHGKWGRYIISFTDPEKYPDMAVECEQEVDNKYPTYVRISDDEGNDHYEW